jgi:acetyl-CoA C-acetyltransferase
MEKVAIVAVAQTQYVPSRRDVLEVELAYEPVKQILEEKGLSFRNNDIDSAVLACQDWWDGRSISEGPIQDIVGGHLGSNAKVTDDSAHAVWCAYANLMTGREDLIMVLSYVKESQTIAHPITNAAFDPIYHRMLGIDYESAAALQAQRYMHKYGITPEQCARVAVKNLRNGKNNPFATRGMDVTEADVLASEMLCDPIRRLEAKPICDGACAILLAREHRAKELTDKPIWIKGVGTAYDAPYLGERELADCDALAAAAKRAYEMAGITDPLNRIDVAEISEEYAYQELMWTEGLGLCERGKGGRLLDSGVTRMGGKLPVNPSGGLLSGAPTIVAGMSRIAEAVLQLREEAGARQVSGAATALAHGVSGPCGQLHCVTILER